MNLRDYIDILYTLGVVVVLSLFWLAGHVYKDLLRTRRLNRIERFLSKKFADWMNGGDK